MTTWGAGRVGRVSGTGEGSLSDFRRLDSRNGSAE